MANSKKWSEQSLVEETFVAYENGKEVKNKKNVLVVCTSGMELYKKHFKEGKYKGKDRLVVPYDFVLIGGDMCPKGEFYEVEYFLGENGMVYRAIVQCVNAVTDLRVMLGCLRRKGILPENFNPIRAWKRWDIDMVHIASCYKDESGEVCTSGGMYGVNDDRMDERMSVDEYVKRYSDQCCLYYYRGDHREFWAKDGDKELVKPIFVCGSENVNDPEFADKKAADMEEMKECIDRIVEITDDYNMGRIIFVAVGMDKDGNVTGIGDCNLANEAVEKVAKSIVNLDKEV